MSDFRGRWIIGALSEFSEPRIWPFRFSSPSFVGDPFEGGSGWTAGRGSREENSVGFSLSRACQVKYAWKVHAPGKRYTSRWSSQLLDSWTDICCQLHSDASPGRAIRPRRRHAALLRNGARVSRNATARNVSRCELRVYTCAPCR